MGYAALRWTPMSTRGEVMSYARVESFGISRTSVSENAWRGTRDTDAGGWLDDVDEQARYVYVSQRQPFANVIRTKFLSIMEVGL